MIVLMVLNMFPVNQVYAASAQLNAWMLASSTGASANAATINAGNVTVSAGTNRLFVATVCMELGGPNTVPVIGMSLGGTTLTPIGSTGATTMTEQCYMGYLLDSQIPAGSNALTVSYDINGVVTVVAGAHIYWASYSGIDQTAPINDSNASTNGANNVTFGQQIDYLSDGTTFYVAANIGSPATMTAPAGFSQQLATTSNGHSSFIGQITAVPHVASNNYGAATIVTFGGTTGARSSLIIASLRPAAITVGDGTSPADKYVKASATNRAVSAFTLSTSSGTDTVTQVTITGTNTGNIAANGAKLWLDNGSIPNEWDAADTQIGTGVSFAGATATITGLGISVNTTPVQYHITYDISATPTNGATLTGYVSGVTATNSITNNDNTDATLTIDSLAPDTAITLNPTNPSNDSNPIFSFVGDDGTGSGVASFECRMDGGGFLSCTSGSTFGPLSDGSHTFEVRAIDNVGNIDTTPVSYTWVIDSAIPTVMINQAAGQADPTNTSPIHFTVVFSEPVTGFTSGDVTLGGSAGATTDMVTEIVPNDGTTYDVAVSGMTGNGTVIAAVAAGVATDEGGNPNNASTSTDNAVTYDLGYPTVVSTDLISSYTGTGPGSFVATFSKAVGDPAGNTGTDDVTNPANYLLVNKGQNGSADTVNCSGGVVADDTLVTVTSVVYNPVAFQATVTLVSPLPVGSYRLFICGTTSIVDLAGNPLNGGSDYIFDFVVNSARVATASLPATGFPQGMVANLPAQPVSMAYSSTNLWLEIPNLKVKMSIVGVPRTKDGWKVEWLNLDAGWLNGSAFPTWNGNSVITAHVWDALNRPGPFANLKNLRYGDQIKVHAFGQVYTYEIRESKTVSPTNISAVFKHEEKSWITLVTCEGYEENSQTYFYRRMVRAVLVNVTSDK